MVTLKKPKTSPSLQNPSDPIVPKGQGYQVQIMETYTEKKKKKTNEESEDESEGVQEDDTVPTLNLITHIDVQTACESDANALIPAIESAGERNLLPEELLTDSLYGSDDNCKAAKKFGTEVIVPAMGSQKEDIIPLSDFTFSEKAR